MKRECRCRAAEQHSGRAAQRKGRNKTEEKMLWNKMQYSIRREHV